MSITFWHLKRNPNSKISQSICTTWSLPTYLLAEKHSSVMRSTIIRNIVLGFSAIVAARLLSTHVISKCDSLLSVYLVLKDLTTATTGTELKTGTGPLWYVIFRNIILNVDFPFSIEGLCQCWKVGKDWKKQTSEKCQFSSLFHDFFSLLCNSWSLLSILEIVLPWRSFVKPREQNRNLMTWIFVLPQCSKLIFSIPHLQL